MYLCKFSNWQGGKKMPSSNGRSSKNNKDDRTKKYKNPTTKTKKTNNDMAIFHQ